MDGGADEVRVIVEATAEPNAYQVQAWDLATNRRATGVFVMPPLGTAITELSRSVSRIVGTARRDIGGTSRLMPDAKEIGGGLAGALLHGEVGELYEAARTRAEGRTGRRVRLSLSLGRAPRLLGLPWELLYQRPRFIASQRATPILRLVDGPTASDPVAIDGALRLLVVIAGPSDMPPLDVAAERRTVEQATADMSARGLLDIDWLEAATPDALRLQVRDRGYEIIHYIGHSDFTPDGQGVIALQRPDGRAHLVDETLLANLLADQIGRLRLVVLNSCHGARTSATDPQAGVAAALMTLGLPAVVAMQFAISDAAAITFAAAFYSDLLERRAPVDVAVAEGRKAIYSAASTIEWATPVLFMRDPGAPLFRFSERTPLEATLTSRVDVSTVMPLLVEYAAKSPTASRRTTQMWEVVAGNLRHDQLATGTLQRLLERPDDPLRAAAVQSYVQDALAGDDHFARHVARILQAEPSPDAATEIRDVGAVIIGGNMNVDAKNVAVRDMYLGAEPSPPAADKRKRRRRDR